MVLRSNAPIGRDFHVVILCGEEIIEAEIFNCQTEQAAFQRAEEMVSQFANGRIRDISGYVLDRNQVFLGFLSAKRKAA